MNKKPTLQEIINASNRARDELLKDCPSHNEGYSELEEQYFRAIDTLGELNKAAAKLKRAAQRAA